MIEWIFQHLGLVIFVAIFISQILRALGRSRKAATVHKTQHDPSAEARRLREVQEQIRRQIAERRGGRTPTAPPMVREREAPVARPQTTQVPELFGGPLGRMLEELQRKAQPQSVEPPKISEHNRQSAELERQQQLANELAALQEAK